MEPLTLEEREFARRAIAEMHAGRFASLGPVQLHRLWINCKSVPLDEFIARSTAEAYELPEHVAARRAHVAARNAPGVWRAAVRRRVLRFVDRNLEALFWPAMALLLAAAIGVYFILENLGWFGL